METWLVKQTHHGVYLSTIADRDERYLEQFMNTLRPPKVSPATFNVYRSYLNMFWNYCLQEGWIRVSPMRRVDRVKEPETEKLVIGATELTLMLQRAATPRDRIALAIGMNTSLRAADIMAIKVGQVDFYRKSIRVWIEKTDKWDDIPMTADLLPEMLVWMDHYAEKEGTTIKAMPNNWSLVPPLRHFWDRPTLPGAKLEFKYAPLSVTTNPHKIVHKALDSIEVPYTKGTGFHVLRRSGARVAYDIARAEGHADPIRIAQDLLGHKNRETTEAYLLMTPEREARNSYMLDRPWISRAAEMERNKQGNLSVDGSGQASLTNLDRRKYA
jgi:integrase